MTKLGWSFTAMVAMVGCFTTANYCTPAEVATTSLVLGDLANALRADNPAAAGVLALASYVTKNARNADDLKAAEAAAKEGDLSLAYNLVKDRIELARRDHIQIPPEVDLILYQTGGLIAANAIQNGMRALSTPTSQKDGGPTLVK